MCLGIIANNNNNNKSTRTGLEIGETETKRGSSTGRSGRGIVPLRILAEYQRLMQARAADRLHPHDRAVRTNDVSASRFSQEEERERTRCYERADTDRAAEVRGDGEQSGSITKLAVAGETRTVCLPVLLHVPQPHRHRRLASRESSACVCVRVRGRRGVPR